jgi:hypothetical protein
MEGVMSDPEICQRCNESDHDRRTLWMSCFYAMEELDLPFRQKKITPNGYDSGRTFYLLTVCKSCRADWMAQIKTWFNSKPEKVDENGDCFYRELGATRSMKP